MTYKDAINDFLQDYINQGYFLGAILTGSYATGNNNENSDIDIYIITKDDIDFRERGNKLVDGFLIEYFINPISKIKDYFEKELKKYHMSTTNIFANGIILLDETGIVQELIDEANNNLKKELPELDEATYKMNCYGVWDGFDELEEKYKKNLDIDFSYYIFLERTINSYFQNKKIPTIPLNKIEYVLNDEEYRNNYHVKKLPDEKFLKLLLDCFKEKDYDKRYLYACHLYDYFKEQFSDFDINNFNLRSNLTK